MTYLAERYLAQKEEREKRKNEITSSLDYIKWLAEYTKTHPEFTNDLQDKENAENIESLDLLYDVIDSYARDNYKYPYKTKWGYYYVLEYEGNYFKIGRLSGEYTIYYCIKTEKENYHTIDFLDIVKGKVSPETALIIFKMKKLELIISELSRVVPEEEIQRQVTNVYRKKINGSH